MSFRDPLELAAWRHRDSRDGYEVVFPRPGADGYRFEGDTAALDGGEAWAVRYSIILDPGWVTRSALIAGRSGSGVHELMVEADRAGHWRINGVEDSRLDGCLDLDLESSSLTNAFPVHRLGLEIGHHADVPAAWVRALDLSVERLEQQYVRLEDAGTGQRYLYRSPGSGFESVISFDEFGLVLEYPGIAVRTA